MVSSVCLRVTKANTENCISPSRCSPLNLCKQRGCLCEGLFLWPGCLLCLTAPAGDCPVAPNAGPFLSSAPFCLHRRMFAEAPPWPPPTPAQGWQPAAGRSGEGPPHGLEKKSSIISYPKHAGEALSLAAGGLCPVAPGVGRCHHRNGGGECPAAIFAASPVHPEIGHAGLVQGSAQTWLDAALHSPLQTTPVSRRPPPRCHSVTVCALWSFGSRTAPGRGRPCEQSKGPAAQPLRGRCHAWLARSAPGFLKPHLCCSAPAPFCSL